MSNSSILVVDDDPDIRDALRDALELEGYAVSLAANGRQALDALNSGPPPALVLLDLMMPIMNGAEFLDLVRADEQLRALPVILVTAFSSTALAAAAKSQGFLPKPLDLDELIGLIARYCPH